MCRPRAAAGGVVMLVTGLLLALPGPALAGKPPRNDATPPSIRLSLPQAGSSVSGMLTVSGTASDNTAVAKVEVGVDGGAYKAASGTTSWSGVVDTASYAAGGHTVFARATDKAGNVAVTSTAVQFGSAPAPAPTPAPTPAPDTTAPTVDITSPSPSSTLSGTVDVTGTAADAGGLARVEVSLDGAPWSLATGTISWAWPWDTARSADGTHTLAARATDLAGNVAATQQADVVQNTVASPTPTLPAGVQEQLVTPEGVTIQILDGVTGWTAQRVYSLLKPSAYELDKVGPDLLIKVQTTYASQTGSSATGTNGRYDSYHATIFLKAASGTTFSNAPDFVIAHEYGHAWTMYHYYLDRQADWSSYLAARGLTGDARVDSTYNWSKTEMIADDYRMLFGSATAVAGASYINSQAPDPRTIGGLKDFFVSSWAKP